ncbi:MAG: hypothetical protein WBQ73_00595 [Candidatus Babeliales bacterium]
MITRYRLSWYLVPLSIIHITIPYSMSTFNTEKNHPFIFSKNFDLHWKEFSDNKPTNNNNTLSLHQQLVEKIKKIKKEKS